MTQPEHTPDPWVVKYGGQAEDAGFTIMARGGRGVIAECWPPAPTEEERQAILANGRLIVMSPNLLQMCQACLGWLLIGAPHAGDDHGLLTEQLEAVIAKIEN